MAGLASFVPVGLDLRAAAEAMAATSAESCRSVDALARDATVAILLAELSEGEINVFRMVRHVVHPPSGMTIIAAGSCSAARGAVAARERARPRDARARTSRSAKKSTRARIGCGAERSEHAHNGRFLGLRANGPGAIRATYFLASRAVFSFCKLLFTSFWWALLVVGVGGVDDQNIDLRRSETTRDHGWSYVMSTIRDAPVWLLLVVGVSVSFVAAWFLVGMVDHQDKRKRQSAPSRMQHNDGGSADDDSDEEEGHSCPSSNLLAVPSPEKKKPRGGAQGGRKKKKSLAMLRLPI